MQHVEKSQPKPQPNYTPSQTQTQTTTPSGCIPLLSLTEHQYHQQDQDYHHLPVQHSLQHVHLVGHLHCVNLGGVLRGVHDLSEAGHESSLNTVINIAIASPKRTDE